MTDEFPRPIHFAAATLAGLVALIHVGLGVWNWARWLGAGFLLPRDVRWPLFVVSGLLMWFGIPAAARRRSVRRYVYVGGIVLALGYVVAYFGWHLGGHRPLFIVGPTTSHEFDLVPFLLDHLFAGPVEFVSIVAEVGLAGVLGYLLVVER